MATIFALSSGALPSGVAVIRISGPRAFHALEKLSGPPGNRREMALRDLRDPRTGDVLDRALTVRFEAPASFTGEDSAEIHCHGSRAVVQAVLGALGAVEGCRLAEPGEFTRRAFENGKLDLTQVEGIGDLIAAQTEAQRRQAVRRMDGALAKMLSDWRARIVGLRAEIEARLDFSDEGDVGALPASFDTQLLKLISEIGSALDGFASGKLIRDGVHVTLAGAPNAGKSTLLNRLAGSDVAIVTEVPGTTRDVLEVSLDLGGYLFVVADTAGLRETDNAVETEGVRRAGARIAGSDLVLQLIAPDSDDVLVKVPENGEIWRIGSKADMGIATVPGLVMEISAQSGGGMDMLQAALVGFAERQGAGAQAGLVSRARDREHLETARAALEAAGGRLDAPELLAEDLRRAGDAIGRLTGAIDAEEVLDRLFAGFCIGK
jgi:tRNA modification GTPase